MLAVKQVHARGEVLQPSSRLDGLAFASECSLRALPDALPRLRSLGVLGKEHRPSFLAPWAFDKIAQGAAVLAQLGVTLTNHEA